MALRDINNRTDILSNYELTLDITDSKCEPGAGIDSFYQQVYRPPVKVAVLGPGCSVACVPTSLVAQIWNLTQVTMSCMSATLSDRTAHSNIFRTVQSTLTTNPGYVVLCKHFGWSKLAILSRSQPAFSSTVDNLVDLMDDNGIEILTNALFQNDLDFKSQLQKIKDLDARVILTYFFENTAVKVFCEVYRMNLYGPKIIWILPNWYTPNWYVNAERDGPEGCLPEYLMAVINYGISIGTTYKNPISGRGIAGMTPKEFDERYDKLTNYTIPYGSKYTHSYYDAVWSIAIALNITSQKLKDIGSNLTLSDMDYGNRFFYDLMLSSFNEMDFSGLLGNTKFNSHGETYGMINIEQRLGTKTYVNGVYYVEKGADRPTMKWLKVIRFQQGKPIRDSAVVIFKDKFMSKPVYGCLALTSALGIVLALVFLTFNVAYRHRKTIKISSPRINNFILFGCVLCYTSIFLQDVEPPHKLYFCTIIKDVHLIGAVLMFSSYDVIVISIRTIVGPFYLHTENMEIVNSSQDDDVLYQLRSTYCKSSSVTYYFDIAISVWHALMLLFGAFLAWETRTISVPSLNDSKLIAICIYSISVFTIIGTAINFVLGTNSIEASGFSASFTLASTTLTQLVVFLPKAIVVIKGNDNSVEPLTEFSKDAKSEMPSVMQ